MTKPWQRDGVWLLYDGECPLCSAVASATRLKEAYGALHLLDARTSGDDPLYREAVRRGLDLNEGMVIAAGGDLHFGAEAVRFIARAGDGRTPTMALARALFRAEAPARAAYPLFRGLRNLALRLKGVGRIGNLGDANER